MAFPLINQLAQLLDVDAQDAQHALDFFVRSIKKSAKETGTVDIPGLGILRFEDDLFGFKTEASLALAVNNRYAALETETVHVAVRDSSSDPRIVSENEATGDNLPASLNLEDAEFVSPMTTDATPQVDEHELSISDSFTPGQLDESESDLPLMGELSDSVSGSNVGQDDSYTTLEPQLPSDQTPTASFEDTITPETVELPPDAPVSMKNDYPDFSPEQPPNKEQQDADWSPLFGEMDDQKSTELNDQTLKWLDSEPPVPPSSPFADSREPENSYSTEGEVEDTLFANPQESDFTPLFIDSQEDESSWADVPVEDASGFFDPPKENNIDNFNEPANTESTYTPPVEDFNNDDFLSPTATQIEFDDTLFNTEPFSPDSEDSTVHEQNTDTFFMPNETGIPAVGSTPFEDFSDQFAPVDPQATLDPIEPATPPPAEEPVEMPPKPSRSRYEERRSNQGSSSFALVALILLGVLTVGGAVGLYSGFLPMPAFLQSSSDLSNEEAFTTTTPQDEPPQGTEIVPAVPPTTGESGGETATETPPATASTNNQPTQASQPPAAFERQRIQRAAGGWTIIVASEIQQGNAEALADQYARQFLDQNIPTDVLVTRVNGQVRYRVGVGQFPTRDAAVAMQRRNASVLPGDAWLNQL